MGEILAYTLVSISIRVFKSIESYVGRTIDAPKDELDVKPVIRTAVAEMHKTRLLFTDLNDVCEGGQVCNYEDSKNGPDNTHSRLQAELTKVE